MTKSRTRTLQTLRLRVAGLPVKHVLQQLGQALAATEIRRAENVGIYVGGPDAIFGGSFTDPRERGIFMRLIEKDYQAAIDDLLGAAFVVGQTYIKRVVEAVVDVAPGFLPRSDVRLGLMGLGNRKIGRDGRHLVSEIQGVNAVANWWKHRDEWPPAPWPAKGRHQPTADTVRMLGARSNSVGQVITAAQRLGITPEDLGVLFEKVRSWAEALEQRVLVEQPRDGGVARRSGKPRAATKVVPVWVSRLSK